MLVARILVCIFLPAYCSVLSQYNADTILGGSTLIFLMGTTLSIPVLGFSFHFITAHLDPMHNMLKEWYETSGINDERIKLTIIERNPLDLLVYITGIFFVYSCLTYGFKNIFKDMFIFIAGVDLIVMVAVTVIALSALTAAIRLNFINENVWK